MPITMYDLHGKLVLQMQANSLQMTIDVSTLKPGIYLIKCGADIKKVVVA